MRSFGVLCCLTTPGLRKDIRRQLRQLYSHQVTYYVHYNYIIITYYHHIYYHILAFISITNLSYFLIQVYFLRLFLLLILQQRNPQFQELTISHSDDPLWYRLVPTGSLHLKLSVINGDKSISRGEKNLTGCCTRRYTGLNQISS